MKIQPCRRTRYRFSPLLDGDGVASALELPHSTPHITGLRTHFGADEVSAPKRVRSANSLITTRLRNSLRTQHTQKSFSTFCSVVPSRVAAARNRSLRSPDFADM